MPCSSDSSRSATTACPRRLRESLIAVGDRRSSAAATDEKQRVALANGGAAWRGWFPLGGELTSGVPDLKEGYYFGRELPNDARPMHGPNIWPQSPASLRPLVTEWMATMEPLAQHVLSLMAEGLGLDRSFFRERSHGRPHTAVPHLPLSTASSRTRMIVGASPSTATTGSLTLLAHDGTAGLQVKVGDDWIDAPSRSAT